MSQAASSFTLKFVVSSEHGRLLPTIAEEDRIPRDSELVGNDVTDGLLEISLRREAWESAARGRHV